MIYLYTGTPGSGKSLHLARDVLFKLKRGGNVIANFPMFFEREKIKGEFIYRPDRDITPEYLIGYAKKNHHVGVEGQTMVIFDECQRIWASRHDRLPMSEIRKWEDFFSLHRHLGYNIILATQNDRMIARYIRGLVEYEVKHRKANNFGFIGMIFSMFHITLFAAVSNWYGQKERIEAEFFTYRKKYSRLYNSYAGFEQFKGAVTEKDVEGVGAQVSDTGSRSAAEGGPVSEPVSA